MPDRAEASPCYRRPETQALVHPRDDALRGVTVSVRENLARHCAVARVIAMQARQCGKDAVQRRADHAYDAGLDRFWAERLKPSRKGTRWDQVLFVLVAHRLIAPGAEWQLHREWYERSALSDLLGADAALADIHTLYRCHDLLLDHKQAVFDHLTARWRDLFNARFEVLLYESAT